MKSAHLTPGNRGTKDNLDTKAIEGKATKLEQQQLLDLYEELARRAPPRGNVDAWKNRTGEIVAAVKALIAGENDAAARLLMARNCKSCHDAHRLVDLPDVSAREYVDEVGQAFRPGNEMHVQVVDFDAGKKSGASGCPSVIIANERRPGIIIWARQPRKEVFEVAAALQKLADGKNMRGFLVVFDTGSNANTAVPALADSFGLETFQIGVPRQVREEIKHLNRALTGRADAIVFVVDREVIRGAWSIDSATLGRDRITMIVNEASKAVNAAVKR